MTNQINGNSASRNQLENIEDGWRKKVVLNSSANVPNNANHETSEFRFKQAIDELARILAGEEHEYLMRLREWGDSDRTTDAPFRRESPINKFLGLFTEIFPDIKILPSNVQKKEHYQSNGRLSIRYSFSLECIKNDKPYSISKLSDGEKQILVTLVDRYFLQDTKCLFIVDEPELNLDPKLACNFWNLMEREMPTSVFIYATHSLDFAMRKNVESVWTIGKDEITELDQNILASLPAEQHRQFLGSIKGVLASDIGIAVEGRETSFDSLFYSWVLKDLGQISVVGYGGCEDVADATRKLKLWKHIAPTANVLGIVDRDYRSDRELSGLEDTGCFALDLHDAESYICHPDIIVALANKLNKDNFPSKEELIEKIKSLTQETMISICAARMTRICSVRRQVSIGKDQIKNIDSVAQLIKTAKQYAENEQENPPQEISPATVASVIREESNRCKKAINENNLDEMLCLTKGKDILEEFACLFGFQDGYTVLEYVTQNLDPQDFEHIRRLRTNINNRFEQA
ncbi:MAG: AAA family ATPase [Cyanobacteria bacterium P01_G01_bin.49]